MCVFAKDAEGFGRRRHAAYVVTLMFVVDCVRACVGVWVFVWTHNGREWNQTRGAMVCALASSSVYLSVIHIHTTPAL